MGKYQEITKDIPWGYLGRETVASTLGKSIVPVGILPFQPKPVENDKMPAISMREKGAEQFLMNIVGTAIQAGAGKLVTCGHVVKALIEQKAKGYILSKIIRQVPLPMCLTRLLPPSGTLIHEQTPLTMKWIFLYWLFLQREHTLSDS